METKKVHLVLDKQGESVRAFSNRERAEKFASIFGGETLSTEIDYVSIAETKAVDNILAGLSLFSLELSKSGDLVRCMLLDPFYSYLGDEKFYITHHNTLYGIVWASHKEEAEKLIREKREKLISNGDWK